MTLLNGRGRRSILLSLLATSCLGILLVAFYLSTSATARVAPFTGTLGRVLGKITGKVPEYGGPQVEVQDSHPIRNLMKDADEAWTRYIEGRSTNFRDALRIYRHRYGRHPPPGFPDWYKYARERNAYNVDDFQQINNDLRPFWAIEPKLLRQFAAHASDNLDHHLAIISIRNHAIYAERYEMWRSSELINLITRFIQFLPDMDIPVNRMDQPRVVVPWEDMQGYLAKEVDTRRMPPETVPGFTKGMEEFYKKPEDGGQPTAAEDDWGWFGGAGRNYMDIAKLACPPLSYARNPELSSSDVERRYKLSDGGLISNFNLSSDLCTVGPDIQDKHGLLFAPSSITATKQLVPVFGECKVNVNSDILFPANMYYMRDDRYDYDPAADIPWDKKKDALIWRGATSGGFNRAEDWRNLHRQRLVLLLNHTEMAGKPVRILSEQATPTAVPGTYTNFPSYHPSSFAAVHADAGFTDLMACVPNGCGFYDDQISVVNRITLAQTFDSKYVVDVDGHSFSGRWRAFLQSRSLGIKATIFREWHDSRLFAWRHFVPMDNRFDDLYSLLTYFIGVGPSSTEDAAAGAGQATDDDAKANQGVQVQRHDYEAFKIAEQGREWAGKVLRREDIEIYTFRLLLEYARVIDDNREGIGYSGDGSEMDAFDAEHPQDW